MSLTIPTIGIKAWFEFGWNHGRKLFKSHDYIDNNKLFIMKSIMEDLLNCKDLYDPIEGDNAKSSDMSNDNWKKLKKKTLGVIR